MEEAVATAHKLAAAATGAIGTVRAQLLASYGAGLEAQLEVEARGIAAAAAGPDGQEGVAAFLQKRRPVFTGRR
jgi:2-(1,2-epoxy-1,2-dihydrophenyl)acetyl-CoA isomerase